MMLMAKLYWMITVTSHILQSILADIVCQQKLEETEQLLNPLQEVLRKFSKLQLMIFTP